MRQAFMVLPLLQQQWHALHSATCSHRGRRLALGRGRGARGRGRGALGWGRGGLGRGRRRGLGRGRRRRRIEYGTLDEESDAPLSTAQEGLHRLAGLCAAQQGDGTQGAAVESPPGGPPPRDS